MKQHLDTIPVWDAYKQDSECPLCAIRARNEAAYVDNFLGGSVMEPAHRVEVNKKGFCERHFRQLFEAGNRLGLALMADTYMKETIARLEENAKRLNEAAAAARFTDRFRKGKPTPGAQTEEIAQGCILCERLEQTMERYVYTLLHMWKHESEFRAAFAASKGLCLAHYADVVRHAPEQLSGAELKEFTETVSRVEMENLRRVEKELEWFTLKFDYRNRDKPWGNSQDAVERAVNKLRGNAILPKKPEA